MIKIVSMWVGFKRQYQEAVAAGEKTKANELKLSMDEEFRALPVSQMHVNDLRLIFSYLDEIHRLPKI